MIGLILQEAYRGWAIYGKINEHSPALKYTSPKDIRLIHNRLRTEPNQFESPIT